METLRRFKNLAWLVIVGVLLILPCGRTALSLPEADEVVNGTATITCPDAATMHINASDKCIVNYRSFDIKANETVIINLPTVNSEILNRVIGNKASEILGKLSSNGVVILVNQNGIFIGPNAQINVGSLVASTRDITNSNFVNSKYLFEKLSPEQLDTLLLNQGTINIRKGGFGALIAGAVENEGTIICPMGTIAIAGGDMVRMDIAGEGVISVAVDKATASTIYDMDGKPVTEQIKNTGRIEADGGIVMFKAEALSGIMRMAINLDGYVQAERLEGKDGLVRLATSGNVQINGQLKASKVEVGKGAQPAEVHGAVEAQDLVTIEARKIDVIARAPKVEFYKPDQIAILTTRAMDNLVTLEGLDFRVTYLKSASVTLSTDNAVTAEPGLIIPAASVRINARQFGSLEVPLNIEANNTYIQRTTGPIELLESLGIGSTIMLRGPPDGFGAIIYSKATNLTLEAESVTILGSEPLHLYGNITFSNLSCTIPGKEIYFEANKMYTILGTLTLEGAEDNYITLTSSIASVENMFGIYINAVSNAEGDPYVEYINVYYSHAYGPVTPILAKNYYIPAELSIDWDDTHTWSGTTSNLWNLAANWGGSLPSAGDDLVFPDSLASGRYSTSNDFTAGTSFNSISINGTGYTLAGNSISLAASITTNKAAGSNTISLNMTFAATRTITVTNSGETLTISGIISGAGGLTKSGAGTLTLGAANTFTGGLYILNGIVDSTKVQSSSASDGPFGPNANIIYLGDTSGSNNATLKWTVGNNSRTLSNPITARAGTSGTLLVYYNNTGYNGTYNGAVTLNNSLTIQQNINTMYFNGAITLGASVTLTCSSTDGVDLGGGVTGGYNLTVKNTTSGGVSFKTNSVNNSGTITNTSTGSGAVYFQGGIGSNVTAIINNAGNRIQIDTTAITVNSTSTTLQNTSTGDIYFSGGGTTGAGNLILKNDSSKTDGIIIQVAVNNTGTVTNSGSGSGNVLINVNNAFGANVTKITQNSATSQMKFNNRTQNFSCDLEILNGTVYNSGTSAAFNDANKPFGTGTIYLGSDTVSSNDATLRYGNWNSDLTLPNNITVRPYGGTLTIYNDSAGGVQICSGAISLNNNLTVQMPVNNTARLSGLITVGSNNAAITCTNTGVPLQITGGVTGTGNFTMNCNSGQNIVISSVAVNNSGTVTNSGTGSGTAIINGVIGTNVTAVTQNSATSQMTLSGANTYTGATTINAGTLKAGVATSGSTGPFGNNSAVTMANVSGAVMNITGYNVSIGSLTGGGTTGGNVTLGTQTLTIGGDNTSPAAYAGVISSSGTPTTSLIKTGTGTLTLSGANTYTGATTINAGTLLANNTTSSTGSGTVTVNSGGTLATSVNGGKVSGNLIVNSGGTVYPGNGTAGITLNVGGTATFNSGSAMKYYFSGASFSKLAVTGTISASETVYIDAYGTPDNTSYNVATYTGTAPSYSNFSIRTKPSGKNEALTNPVVAPNLTLTFSSAGYTISGTISGYTTSGTSVYLYINGGGTQYAATTDGSGNFTSSAISWVSGDALLIYLYNVSSNSNYVGILPNPTGNITGLGLSVASVTIGNPGSGTAVTNNTLYTARQSVSDPYSDIIYSVSAPSGGTATFTEGVTIASGVTYAPAGNINIAGNWTNSGTYTKGSETITFNGSSTQVFTPGGSTYNSITVSNNVNLGGALTLSSTLTVDSNKTLDVAGYTLTLGSSTTNNGTIKFSGASNGKAVSTGTVEYYGSNQTVATGTYNNLTVSNGSTKTLGGAVVVNGTMNVGSGTTLDIAGNTVGIAGLTGNGTIDNLTGTASVTVGNNNATSQFDGIIQNTAGTLSLTKTGSGTLTLSGANTYTGGTAINAGQLTCQHSNALGNGSVTVGGGTLASSVITSLNINGNLTLNSGAVNQTANLAITGDYVQTGGTFSCADPYDGTSGDTFTVGGSFSITPTDQQSFDRYDGTGVEGDEYLIRDVYDLQAMNCWLGENFVLGANIDATPTSHWNPDGSGGYYGFDPIAHDTNPAQLYYQGSGFSGTFDGQGYTITGLYVRSRYPSAAGSYAGGGLFASIGGWIDTTARIENLGLIEVDIEGNRDVGGLVGINEYGTIENCYTTGRIYSEATGPYYEITSFGGLVGDNKGAIIRCYSHADVITTSPNSGYAGGLVGHNHLVYTAYGTTTITESYATGYVESGRCVGGLVGLQWAFSKIEKSYATGNAKATSYSPTYYHSGVGGLLGWNDEGQVNNCYATGDVFSENSTYGGAGGLVGYNKTGGINNSYSTGIAQGNAGKVGGLIGDIDAGNVKNSFATGNVIGNSGSPDVGALVGEGTTGFTNCYRAGMVTNPGGSNTTGNATTIEALKVCTHDHPVYDQSNPTDKWDFWPEGANDIWFMAGYPVLTMQYSTTITNVYQLQMMALKLTASYTLANNINAAETSTWAWDGSKYLGFAPVGDHSTKFTGQLNGQYYSIDSLYFNRDLWTAGLFGEASGPAQISNIGITNLNFTTGGYVGGIAGVIGDGASITNVFATGSITRTAPLEAGYAAGGIVGSAGDGSTLSYSYSSVHITGKGLLGGLIGETGGAPPTISNCYFNGSVTNIGSGGWDRTGGLIGLRGRGNIYNSYVAGPVSGGGAVGGLIGSSASGDPVENSFWDIEVTGQATSSGGTGLHTWQMKQQSNFTNWDFDIDSLGAGDGDGDGYADQDGIWLMAGYPHLQVEWRTDITNIYQLQMMQLDLDAHYTLVGNIDGIGDGTAADPLNTRYWNSYQDGGVWKYYGFMPIGDASNYGGAPFAGRFDGLSHTISGITIINPPRAAAQGWVVGLFGALESAAQIRNFGLLNVDVSGDTYVGALAGLSSYGSTITNCYATGIVTGGSQTGGLVGQLSGNAVIDSCYSIMKVSGGNYVGGLTGELQFGIIINSYSLSTVTGSYSVGGLTGFAERGTITNCYVAGKKGTSDPWEAIVGGILSGKPPVVTSTYWDTSVSGKYMSNYGTGYSTSGMMTKSNFVGWDFDGPQYIWSIEEGATYPYLRWRYGTDACAVSGVVYTTSAHTTPVGSNVGVGLAIGGVKVEGAESVLTGVNGSYYYLMEGSQLEAGADVLLYTRDHATYKGNTATIASGASLTGLDLYGDSAVIVRHENAGPITNADLAAAKGSLSDSNILYTYSGQDVTLASAALYLPQSYNYTPGGNLSCTGLTVNGTLTTGNNTITAGSGGITIGANGVLNATGTPVVNVGGNWTNNGTFNAGGGTVTFDGSSAQTIVTGGTGVGKNFYNVIFDNSNGAINVSTNNLTIGGTVTLNRATTITATDLNTTITGATTGDYTLALVNGTGDISLGSVNIDTLTLTSGDDLTLNGNLYTDTALSFVNIDDIILGASLTIQADDAGTAKDITFDSDNLITGAFTLAIDGDTVTLYTIGNDSANPTQLTVTSDTATHLYGNLYINGNITFNDAIVLEADVVMDTDGGVIDGDITFGSTLDSDSLDTQRDLTLTAGTGDVAIGGAIGATDSLFSLYITGNDISLNNVGAANTAAIEDEFEVTASDRAGDAGSITFTGDTYNIGPAGAIYQASSIVLNQNTEFKANNGNIGFGGALDSQEGIETLVINGPSVIIGFGPVGSSSPLGSLTINGADQTHLSSIGTGGASGVTGGLNINSGLIIFSGSVIHTGLAQTYVASTNWINTSTTFKADNNNISFTGQLYCDEGNNDLIVNAGSGDVTFNDVMNDGSLASITVTGNTIKLNDAATIGSQSYTATNIDLNGTTYTSTTGSLTFTGAVDLDSTGTVTLTTGAGSGDNISITGALADTGSNSNLTIVAGASGLASFGSTVTLGGNFTNTSGATTLGGTTTVGGNFTITAGSVTAPASLSVAGNWSNSGTFTCGSGTVTFDGTAAQSIKTNNNNFNNVILNNAANILNLTVGGGNMAVGGALTIASGKAPVITTNNQNFTVIGTTNGITAGVENFTLTAGTGDVTFSGAVGNNPALGSITINSAQNVTAASTISAASFTQSDGTGTTTFGDDAADTVELSDRLEITTGNIVVNAPITAQNHIYLKDDNNLLSKHITTNASLTSVNSYIQFIGHDVNIYQPLHADAVNAGFINISAANRLNLSAQITANGASALTAPSVNFNSGASWTLNNTLTVDGDLYLYAGSLLQLGSSTLELTGDLTNDYDLLDTQTGTVSFTGSTSIFGAIPVFHNVNITGTLNAPENSTIYVAGDWANWAGASGFVHNNSNVIFIDNPDTAEVDTTRITGDTTFFDFTCQTQDKPFIFRAGSTQTIEGTLTLGVDDESWAGHEISLNSDDPALPDEVNRAKRFNLIVSQDTTIFYCDVRNSEVLGDPSHNITDRHFLIRNIFDNNDNLETDEFSPPRWIFGINIDGQVFADDAETPVGAGVRVWVYVNDGNRIIYSGFIDTFDALGHFHFIGVPVGPDYSVLLFLQNDTYQANAVTIAQDYITNITDPAPLIKMYNNRLTLRHESEEVGPMTNAALDLVDRAVIGMLNTLHAGYVHFNATSNAQAGFDLETYDGMGLWLPSGYTYTPGGALNISGSVINEGAFNCESNNVLITKDLRLEAGTFNAPDSSGILTIRDSFVREALATFVHNSGKVIFDHLASGQTRPATFTINAPGVVFNDVDLLNSCVDWAELYLVGDFSIRRLKVQNQQPGLGYDIYGFTDPGVPITGTIPTLTVTDLLEIIGSGNNSVWFGDPLYLDKQFKVDLKGDFKVDANRAIVYSDLDLTGTARQTLRLSAGSIADSATAGLSTITINKAAGTVELATDFTNNYANIRLVAGSFDAKNHDLALTSFIQDGGTFTSGSGNMDVNRDLLLYAGSFTAPSANLYIAGDLRAPGNLFNHNRGTVIFDNAALVSHLYGATTFNNLTCTELGKELQFEAGSTKTVSGTLTLRGAANSLLRLRSTTPNQQWTVNIANYTAADAATGRRFIEYIDVKDSYNASGVYIFLVISHTAKTWYGNSLGFAVASNNTNWFEPIVTPPEPPEPPPVEPPKVEAKAPQVALGDNFVNYDEEKKYKKYYTSGKYRTVVIVFEGKVAVSPYDEEGIIEEEVVTLTAGQKATHEEEVK